MLSRQIEAALSYCVAVLKTRYQKGESVVPRLRLILRQLPLGLLVLIAAGLLSAPAALSAPGVELSFPALPGRIGPGRQATISIAYDKDPSTAEKRLVFILEMRRLEGDSLLNQSVSDNSAHGYGGDSGVVDFSVTAPAEGPVYFAAFAAPWSLNRAVVEHYQTYPTDGTYDYSWTSGSYGVTQDLYYLGDLIAPTTPDHTTYCCGITFETFLLASENYNATYGHSQIGTMSASDMRSFRRLWYGVTDDDELCARAIRDYAIGEEINDWEEIQDGDFVQFWRHSGSGHSVIFQKWVRDAEDAITGFQYWSSQRSTQGIGSATEYFGDSSGVNPDRFWPARLQKPRDEADFDWALGQSDTRSTPTRISEDQGSLLSTY